MINLKRLIYGTIISFSSISLAGSKVILDSEGSGNWGTIDVNANAIQKVSLSISDTGGNNLVGFNGINFGDVDAEGTTGNVTGVQVGDSARYEADFSLSASRTGAGSVTLTVERPTAGSFHPTDGVLIQDDSGVLQPLGAGGSAVTVIDNKAEGDFTRKLGIMVHSTDEGLLTTELRLTLSAM